MNHKPPALILTTPFLLSTSSRYAFNDYQMFRGLYAAAQFLGPVEMLRQWQALGKTGFVWLRHFALAWMSLSTNSQAPAPHPPSRTPNHQPSTLVSTRGAYCSHLNGTMLGYWDQTHRLSPGYIFIRGDHLGNVVVYQVRLANAALIRAEEVL